MSNYETPPPVPPIAQAYVSTTARPGLVTAMGIVSIILSAWIILISIMMIMHMTVMGFLSAMPMATPVMPTTNPTTAPTTTISGTIVVPGSAQMTMTTVDMRPDESTVVWLSATSLVNVILSIVLLWAGIATLRRKTSGRSLHNFWAIAKIMLVPMLAYAEFLYMEGMFTTMIATMPPGPPSPAQMFDAISAVSAVFNAIFSLVYPVTLLFLLRARSVKEFFATAAT